MGPVIFHLVPLTGKLMEYNTNGVMSSWFSFGVRFYGSRTFRCIVSRWLWLSLTSSNLTKIRQTAAHFHFFAFDCHLRLWTIPLALKSLRCQFGRRMYNLRDITDLRDSEIKLDLPKLRRNYYKRAFGYSGALLWNSLPTKLRNQTLLRSFKREIDVHYNNLITTHVILVITRVGSKRQFM